MSAVRKTSFDGDVLLTREILLTPDDYCSLDQCGLCMKSADPERAIVLATPHPAGAICIRFCCKEHAHEWARTEIPQECKFLLSNSRTFALGEVIGCGRIN